MKNSLTPGLPTVETLIVGTAVRADRLRRNAAKLRETSP
jgi:hypothetical protein